MKRFGLKPQCGGCANLMNDINDIARFYRRQKIMEDEERFCNEHNYNFYSLHRTIEVRWTASAYRALLSVFENWRYIIEHLQEMLDSPSNFDQDTLTKIGSLMEILLNKNFIALLALGKFQNIYFQNSHLSVNYTLTP